MNTSIEIIQKDLSLGFRSLFYLISHKEFETEQEVIISKAIPWFVIFIAFESLIGHLRGHKVYRLNDGLSSLSLGMVSEQWKLWGKSVSFLLYQKVSDKYGMFVFDGESNYSLPAFIFALVMVDFFYYWFHRFTHEFHFAFTQHSVHHSGEDYNLATALRQGAFQWLLGAFFTLPLAIIIPPLPLAGHFFVNSTAQFWIHTSQIGTLGILEYIFNTPSNHRCHHRPPGNCNYGGILIIFDKIFGTYVCETEHLDYYGLAKQYDTFDPVVASIEHGRRVIANVDNGAGNPIMALFKRRVKHRFVFEPMALFRKNPEPKQSLWILPTKSYRKKLGEKTPFVLNVYIVLLFLIQLVAFTFEQQMMIEKKLELNYQLFWKQFNFFFGISCLGRLLDGFRQGRQINTFRVLIMPWLNLFFLPQSPILFYSSILDCLIFIGVSMSLVGSAN